MRGEPACPRWWTWRSSNVAPRLRGDSLGSVIATRRCARRIDVAAIVARPASVTLSRGQLFTDRRRVLVPIGRRQAITRFHARVRYHSLLPSSASPSRWRRRLSADRCWTRAVGGVPWAVVGDMLWEMAKDLGLRPAAPCSSGTAPTSARPPSSLGELPYHARIIATVSDRTMSRAHMAVVALVRR